MLVKLLTVMYTLGVGINHQRTNGETKMNKPQVGTKVEGKNAGTFQVTGTRVVAKRGYLPGDGEITLVWVREVRQDGTLGREFEMPTDCLKG